MADYASPPHNIPSSSSRVEGPESLPPTYSIPTQFTIGTSLTPEALVKIPEIKGHLALLHAFAELKNRVESLEVLVPYMPVDEERRWGWFVGLAVERFDKWCQSLRPEDSTMETEMVMPPVDVLMVWHAYMLNPRWYAEDCMRKGSCTTLQLFEPHFKWCMRNQFREALSSRPSQARLEFWLSRTSQPFDYIDGIRSLNERTIACPLCSCPIRVELMNQEGTGYLQQQFFAVCPRDCSIGDITKEKLAFRKLAEDLAAAPPDCLPGTLHSPFSPADTEHGNRIKLEVAANVKAYGSFDQFPYGSQLYSDQLIVAIMAFAEFSLARLKVGMGPASRLKARILSAYDDDKIYSVELVGSVLRQGSFVKKMYDLGWTRPGFFDEQGDELALQHALARYHAFLDLLSNSPTSFFVPTLDIDLVWHTHQLMPRKYEADCFLYVGRFIDHDDKVEGLRLSSAFDITCRAWKERFTVQYSHCGCPLPGDSIGKRLSHLIHIHSHPPPSHLVPFDRPDLLSATHPSDHNAVRFTVLNEKEHKLATLRYENLARQKEKEAKKAAKKAAKLHADGHHLIAPHLYPAGSIQISKSDPGCAYMYAAPFLVPVPLFLGAGVAEGAGCVSGNGSVVDPGGGCGNVGYLSPFLFSFQCRSCINVIDVYPSAAAEGVEVEVVAEGEEELAAAAGDAVVLEQEAVVLEQQIVILEDEDVVPSEQVLNCAEEVVRPAAVGVVEGKAAVARAELDDADVGEPLQGGAGCCVFVLAFFFVFTEHLTL